MISGNFCLCSCGRCKVEAKETEPELVLGELWYFLAHELCGSVV